MVCISYIFVPLYGIAVIINPFSKYKLKHRMTVLQLYLSYFYLNKKMCT